MRLSAKKLLLAGGLVLATLATLPLFAAFEAHVINVTAQIENALFVHPQSRKFGTVFPQEHLGQGIFVTFSSSFSDEDQERVGNIEYKIVQKPKPLESYVNEVGLDAARAWCHDNYPGEPFDPENEEWIEYLGNCYPSLCPYLSKEPDNSPLPGNDVGLPPFHDPFDPSSVATGKIEKFGTDVGDNWIIDLAVPCFIGQCGQDWPAFVSGLNPNAGDPKQYQLPAQLESEVFGCNLWVEVTKIY